jgi:hypothetical protein
MKNHLLAEHKKTKTCDIGNPGPGFMSRCKLRTPWPIDFKLRTVIGIDSLTVCILFGEISIFHMSRCKLRTPWPIDFKLRTVIGIDSLTVCVLFGEI